MLRTILALVITGLLAIPAMALEQVLSDAPAAVLNYAEFGDQTGINGNYWYEDPDRGCVYKRHGHTTSEVDTINFNGLDPTKIKYQVKGKTTYIMYEGEPLIINVTRKPIDPQKALSGFIFVFDNFCNGL
jgi:hypothetical protein